MCVCAVGFGVSSFKLVVVNSTDSRDIGYYIILHYIIKINQINDM